MKTKQLSFDDIVSNRLEIGDTVEIVAVPDKRQDIETFYYLQEFSRKQGKLVRIYKYRNSTSFEVEFPNGQFGVFYEHEIKKMKGANESEISQSKRKRTNSKAERKNQRV